MKNTLEAMKRVIAKRRERGASDENIQKCIDGWLSIYKNSAMREKIKLLK